MFYNEQARENYRRAQKKIDLEKIGSIFALGISYHYGGFSVAALLGLMFVVYSLSEIQKSLNYQNFMKEKEIGIHDLND
jgi:hypothetical protein